MGLFAKKTASHAPTPIPAGATKEKPGRGTTGAYFGKDITITGTISGKDPVEVHGVLDGEIFLKGYLEIGRHATIKGNVTADAITVSGKVNGKVTAGNTFHLDPSASISGSVTTPKLSVQEGAVFNGELKMGAQEGGGDP